MTKLLLLTALLASLAFGQVSLTAQPPPPVTVAGGIAVGARGGSTLYYWVVARYPAGAAQPSSPAVVPNTVGELNLSVSNYVTVNWSAMPGATGYDVLRSSSPVYPASPSCSCAVVLNTAGTSVNDTGGALSAYPPGGLNAAVPVNGYLTINNRDEALPYVNLQLLSLRLNELLRVGLISGTPAENDCMKYVGGRLASAGAACGSGGGSANLPWQVTRENGTATNSQLRITCSNYPYCTITPNGAPAFSTNTDMTCDISANGASVSGTVYLYYTPTDQTVYCAESTTATVTGGGGATAAVASAIPDGSIPIGVPSGAYAFNSASAFTSDPATLPQKISMNNPAPSGGANITVTRNSTTGEVTIDTASTIPTKAAIQSGTVSAATTGGSSTAYTLTLSPILASYTDKQVLQVKFHTACGATPTINVNGIGDRKLYKYNGTSAPAQLGANECQATSYTIQYDSALDSGTGGFLLNPGGASGGTPAGSGTEVQYRAGASTFGALSGSDITDTATSRQLRITADTNDSACFSARRADTLTSISMCQGDSGNYPISVPYINSLGDFHLMRSSVGTMAFKSGSIEIGSGPYVGNPSGATMVSGPASYWSRYNAEDAAGVGAAYIRASSALTAQTDSIASGNLLATALAGTYRVNTYIHTTAPEGSACTADISVGWTYNGASKTKTIITAHDLNSDEAASDNVTVIKVDNSTAITRAVTDSCTRSAYTYDITMVLERIQ